MGGSPGKAGAHGSEEAVNVGGWPPVRERPPVVRKGSPVEGRPSVESQA